VSRFHETDDYQYASTLPRHQAISTFHAEMMTSRKVQYETNLTASYLISRGYGFTQYRKQSAFSPPADIKVLICDCRIFTALIDIEH
jgi:hypothetical protein